MLSYEKTYKINNTQVLFVFGKEFYVTTCSMIGFMFSVFNTY